MPISNTGFLGIFLKKIYVLFIYLGCIGSWLRHAGSSVAVCELFAAMCGLLSSCGMQVFFFSSLSLVVVHGLQSAWAL